MAETTYMHSTIWLEEPEPNNAFACRAAYCHGYDVYGEMLGNAGWVDMLYLLVKGEARWRARRWCPRRPCWVGTRARGRGCCRPSERVQRSLEMRSPRAPD
jgi:hypothetical protein